MADNCGTCLNLSLREKSSWSDKYWCRERHDYFAVGDRACSYYNEDPNRVRNSSDCYITTMVCSVLGYGDDCELLTTLRSFRENVLRPNLAYLNILVEYDNIGPQICKAIRQIPEAYGFCLNVANNFLIPCCKYIQEEKVEEAIQTYENMVHYLVEVLDINVISLPEGLTLTEEERANVGKGRTLVKPQSI